MQISASLRDVLLEHSHAHWFASCLWLLSCSNSRAEQLRLTTRPPKAETLTPWTLYKALADTKQNQPLSSGLRVYFRSLDTGEEGTGQEGEGLEWQNLMPHVPLKRSGHPRVVQRLGLYAFTADGSGSIPVR